MSIQPGGGDAAQRAREQFELGPEDDPDGARLDAITDDAGDRPPVSDSGISTYPATEALLRPAIYRDPSATIEIPPVLLAGPLNSARLPSGRLDGGRTPDFVRGRMPTRPPQTAPQNPRPAPQQREASPEPQPTWRLPFLQRFWPFTREPNAKPPEQEPQPAGQTEAAPSPDNKPAEPSPETDNPPSSDFGKALEAYLLQPDNRGTPYTTEGNRILAEECRSILDTEFEDIAKITDHVGGSYKDGDLKKYLKELADDPRRADLSWAMNYLDAKILAQVNTASMRKDGSLTKREQEAFDELVKQTGKGVMAAMRKLRPGDDVDEYRQEARDTCRKIFDELRKKKQEKDLERNSSKLKKKPDKDGPRADTPADE